VASDSQTPCSPSPQQEPSRCPHRAPFGWPARLVLDERITGLLAGNDGWGHYIRDGERSKAQAADAVSGIDPSTSSLKALASALEAEQAARPVLSRLDTADGATQPLDRISQDCIESVRALNCR
jgi:hypothetical protein